MKMKTKKKNKKRIVIIDEKLKDYFPPTDRMGTVTPTRWDQVKPASTKPPRKVANLKGY